MDGLLEGALTGGCRSRHPDAIIEKAQPSEVTPFCAWLVPQAAVPFQTKTRRRR